MVSTRTSAFSLLTVFSWPKAEAARIMRAIVISGRVDMPINVRLGRRSAWRRALIHTDECALRHRVHRHVPRFLRDPRQPINDVREAAELEFALLRDVRVGIKGEVRDRGVVADEVAADGRRATATH